MITETHIDRFIESLLAGDRPASRAMIDDLLSRGATPEQVVADLCWPAYENVERSFRQDKLTRLVHHLATRLLRVLVDQTAARFTRLACNGRSIFAFCGPTDADELAAQMAVDLLEAHGYEISFAGGGIAADEILAQVQANQPDVLLLFASAPSDLPAIREMIDTMHEIGACRRTQVVVGGGVFNRADGLAEEIGADLWASDPMDLVETIENEPGRRAAASQRTVGKKRRAA